MGAMKVLLPWQGQPLIRHVTRIALASRLDRLVVVTGNEAAAVAGALAGLPVTLVQNDRYHEGLSGSLRVGLAALEPNVDAALIMLADQPLLTTIVIDLLIERYEQGDARIVAPFAAGQRGNPVLFSRSLFPELETVRGDQGARSVLRAYRDEIAGVEVASDVLVDIDTPDAYRALLGHVDIHTTPD